MKRALSAISGERWQMLRGAVVVAGEHFLGELGELMLNMVRNFVPFLSPTFHPWKFRNNAKDLERYREAVVREDWALSRRST